MIDVSNTLDMYQLNRILLKIFKMNITNWLTNCEFAENSHKKNSKNSGEIHDKCEKKMK